MPATHAFDAAIERGIVMRQADACMHREMPLRGTATMAPATSAGGQSCLSSHFTGKEGDSESGNDYFGARYYASSMGRFLSPDPILQNDLRLINPQRWNKYAYVINNPLILTDPTGKDAAYVNFNKMASGYGHSGLLSIHADGSATYSRFGPKSGGLVGTGEVQTDHELPSVQFGADGLPTPASYAAVIQAVGF
jgi:RHS repeat-associated protein